MKFFSFCHKWLTINGLRRAARHKSLNINNLRKSWGQKKPQGATYPLGSLYLKLSYLLSRKDNTPRHLQQLHQLQLLQLPQVRPLRHLQELGLC